LLPSDNNKVNIDSKRKIKRKKWAYSTSEIVIWNVIHGIQKKVAKSQKAWQKSFGDGGDSGSFVVFGHNKHFI
jgi:hypothetical protein